MLCHTQAESSKSTHATTRHLHLHSCMRCVCARVCVRVVVYIFTLVLVLAIFTPPAHFTRRLWLLFLHYFLHISISALACNLELFFSFSFNALPLPCTHDFQSPVAFKRSRQTERTESEKRAAAARARPSSRQQAAGERQGCRCCTHLCLLHSRLPTKCRSASLALSPTLSHFLSLCN